MRARLALIATTAAALLPAAGAHAAFFAADPIDGPSPDIESVGDLDVARDGNGVVTYVRRDGGVDHVFASRMVSGAFQAPERLDAGLDGPGSQPAAAASDGGRLVVAFVNGGQLYVVVRPAGASGWTAPQPLGASASAPSVDMSINGVAYVTFSTAGDVRAARLDRGATTFTLLDAPLDVDPSDDAGTGTGRSRVAVSADGTAVAVWGENGHVMARRLFGLNVSQAPQDLTLDQLDGHAGGVADLPAVDIEDDSSFAWITFRQQFADGAGQTARAIGRRLRGSRLEDPVAYDNLAWGGGDSVATVGVDLNGRGQGVATAGTAGGASLAGVLKDDVLNPALTLASSGAPSQPMGAIAETTDRVVGFVDVADATVHGVFYDDRLDVRTVPLPSGETVLSNPDLGPVDPRAGFDVAGNRVGDFSFVFVQGTGPDRRLVAASYDRVPGAFRTYTSSRYWRNVTTSPLTWGAALDLWGPLTYTVMVDGKPVAATQDTKAVLPPGLPDGQHTWRVVASDRRGQTATSSVRPLRIDDTPPTVGVDVKRRKRVLSVSTHPADVLGPTGQASGVAQVTIDFGDGSVPVALRKASHRYAHKGTYTVRVTAIDKAGNQTVSEKVVRIGGK